MYAFGGAKLYGQLYRDGALYTQEPIEVFDHDWTTLATGVAIPHGLYDMTDNVGYIHIGTSHDTREFACDSIRHWWNIYGKARYPQAKDCEFNKTQKIRIWFYLIHDPQMWEGIDAE